MILRTLEQDNAKLDKREGVTIDSIRRHTRRHFHVAAAGESADIWRFFQYREPTPGWEDGCRGRHALPLSAAREN